MRSSLAPDMHVGVGCRKGSPYAKNQCGPDTPGGVSLREFFGIMLIDLSPPYIGCVNLISIFQNY